MFRWHYSHIEAFDTARILLVVAIGAVIFIALAVARADPGSEEDPRLPTVAVLDFQANNVSYETARGVSDLLSSHLWQTRSFRVLERDEVIRKIEAITEPASGAWVCDEVACAVDIGRKLEITSVVIGSVSRFGDVVTISVRVVDVGSGEVVQAKTADAWEGESGIPKTVRGLADVLAGHDTVGPGVTGNADSLTAAQDSLVVDDPSLAKPRKPVGSLLVDVDQSTAEILLDGVHIGRGTLTIHDVATGEHVVDANCRGYEATHDTVVVHEGQQSTLRLSLKYQDAWYEYAVLGILVVLAAIVAVL